MKKQSGFIGIIVLVIVAIAAVGAGSYVIVKKSDGVKTSTKVSVSTKATTTADTTAVVTPKTNVNVVATTSTTVKPVVTLPTAKVNVEVDTKAAVVAGSPRDIFVKSRQELATAKNFDEAMAVAIKYGTKEKVALYESQKSQVTPEIAAFGFSALTLIPALNTVTIVSEKITGNTATLSLTTTKDKSTGTVTMKNEGGVWKIEGEAWGR